MIAVPRRLSLLIPTFCSAVTMAAEEPDFDVLADRDDYEVRSYSPYLVAEGDVRGPTRAMQLSGSWPATSSATTRQARK